MIARADLNESSGGDALGAAGAKTDAPPEPRLILGELERAIADAAGFYDVVHEADRTRFCEWDGQSTDGRKHAGDLGRDPFPWEGASDTLVRLADATAGERVKMMKQAFFRAKLQAAARESSDLPRSRAVSTLLQWTRDTLMADHLRDEVAFLANFRESYGSAVMRVGWERVVLAEEKTITMEAMIDGAIAAGADQAAAAGGDGAGAQEIAAANAEQIRSLVMDPANEEIAVAMAVEGTPGVGKSAARRIIRELRRTGASTYGAPFVAANRPVVRALIPFVDVFFPVDTCDIQRARWVAEIETMTPAELRARAAGEGWDTEWVEEVCGKHKGELFTESVTAVAGIAGGAGRGWAGVSSAARREMVQVIHIHWTGPDEAGHQSKWCAAVHQSVDGCGYHMRSPYRHGRFPFVVFRTEHAMRPVIESRGVPEIVRPHQAEIKVQRDSRTDRTSISTVPPLLVPGHRAGMRVNIGPGVQIPERRQGEHRWMDPPRHDQGSIEIEAAVQHDVDRYFGRQTEQTPAPLAQLHGQDLVDDFLAGMREVFGQVFALMQQFMDPVTVSRVTGIAGQVLDVDRESIQGQWDISCEFDVREFDTEYLAGKLKLIADIVVPLDTAAVIDRARLVGLLLGAIDPGAAAHVMQNVEDAAASEVEGEKNAVVQMAAGVEPEMVAGGQNHALRLQVLQETIERSPALAQRLQGDQLFRALVENRAKHHAFQVQQEQNKQTGRLGASRVLGG